MSSSPEEALTSEQAFIAWQVLRDVSTGGTEFGSKNPITKRLTKRRAERLFAKASHALGKTSLDGTNQITVEALLDGPSHKDLTLLHTAVQSEIKSRAEFSERNGSITNNPAWAERDKVLTGLYSIITEHVSSVIEAK